MWQTRFAGALITKMGRAKKKYRRQRKADRPKDLTKEVVRKLREKNKKFVDEKGYIRHEVLKDNSKGIDPIGIYPVCRDNGKGRLGR